jgi:hypothetical protein
MKISTHIWTIFPEDAHKLWDLFESSGIALNYNKGIWYTSPQNKIQESPPQKEQILKGGPFAGACMFKMCIFDSDRIYALLENNRYFYKNIKNLSKTIDAYFIYRPEKREEYLAIFAKNKKHLAL